MEASHPLVPSPGRETDEERAIRFRYRAEELRALAMIGPHGEIRDALLIIAEYYDTAAQDLESERKFG
jgi:hypothetical protein